MIVSRETIVVVNQNRLFS